MARVDLKISDQIQTATVSDVDTVNVFTVKVAAGPADIEATMLDRAGNHCAAPIMSLSERNEPVKRCHVCKSALPLLAALLLASLASLQAAEASKPNVVILLADDLRPDGLASLGISIVKTPNMDKLVSSGFIFRRAYVMGAMTPGVCMPSRTMLLTGMSVFRAVAAAPQPLKSEKGKPVKSPSGNTPDEFTFPRTMQAAGYATLHVGKKPLSPKTITDEFEETVDTGESSRVADVAVDFIQRKAGTMTLPWPRTKEWLPC